MAALRRHAVIAIGGITCTLAATLLFGWWQVDGPGAPRPSVHPSALPLSFDEMDFQLINHFGRKVGPKTWIGRPTLAFFGFTYCPDVCPTTLSHITKWLDGLGGDTSQFQTAFITVDPARDTVQEMATYVSNFHSSVVGYTGSSKQISEAAKGFNVTYQRVSTKDSYTMNHTAGVFVYDASGKFVSIIDYHEPLENAVPKILRALR